MKLLLDSTTLAWQRKARGFAEDDLIPHEVEAELNDGRLPEAVSEKHRRRARELGFSAMDVPREHGGLALRNVDQVAVWEQLGRVTNALCWCFSEPHQWMFDACSDEQLQRYVLPLMKGDRKECYAITERESGSDVAIATTAQRDGENYVLNGEKWYVTSANLADYMFVQAVLEGGDHAGSDVLLFVDIDSPGVSFRRTPLFSHTFDHHHPEVLLENVRVPVANLVGQEGAGMAYTHSWFRRERLMIAARNCGAMARLIEEASDFAAQRKVGGERLADKQMVQAMLADSVTDWWAARLMTFEAAAAHDRGEDLKALHARCSIAKLYATEAAGRVADRAQQVFGGRGYMRENCAERFARELRVDRIWEGASEVQRLIIARALARRGLDNM
ncbi:MAG: acyl-CoA/acyl-ACP dehydrogenase [Xanthomonadales bacterium]|nr:acyl-CoA/acyl-ACP dehydrogenase [Gammaproteobacteria bacterium]NNE06322.1 acyl-CoA/acyl-ACP dehydrogenase [Xanthomonadales bacterium]NNL95506.1 acyl-CoA/acyl-ACP dehydrogenase [Xanthomonadales bacterium]